jgi:hypothetical protein
VKFLILILVLASSLVKGDSSSLNLNIPTSPQSYASDRIRAGNLDCYNAIGSSTNVEFGVVGFINKGYNNPYSTNINTEYLEPQEQVKDIGVYARINIPIGAPKERINCNILYELELEKKRLEVAKLKRELENLRNPQFIEE